MDKHKERWTLKLYFTDLFPNQLKVVYVWAHYVNPSRFRTINICSKYQSTKCLLGLVGQLFRFENNMNPMSPNINYYYQNSSRSSCNVRQGNKRVHDLKYKWKWYNHATEVLFWHSLFGVKYFKTKRFHEFLIFWSTFCSNANKLQHKAQWHFVVVLDKGLRRLPFKMYFNNI